MPSLTHRSTRLLAVVGLMMAIVVAGCGSDDSSTSSTSGSGASAPATDNNVRVALVQAATADLPFQIADSDGAFKKQGLDVSLKTPSIPFSQLPAALGKQFDVVIGSQPDLIRAKASGIDIVAIAGLQRDNPKDPGAALVVSKDSPIKGIEDLKGKTVGAPSLVGNNWSALQCWAKKNGVSQSDFKGVEGPVPQLPELLDKKRVDSILIFEPLLTPAVDGGARYIGNAYEGCFGGAEWTSILLAQGKWAASHGDQIAKLIKGLEAGTAAMAKDTKSAKQLYIKTSGLPPAAAARTPIIPDEFDFSQGEPLVENVKSWLGVLSDLGTFKGQLDPASVVASAG